MTRAPNRIWTIAAAIALAAIAVAIIVNLRDRVAMDFVAYWAAAKLALAGNAAGAYDLALHKTVERQAVVLDAGMPFAYPPPYLIPILPFGLLPFGVAAIMWVTSTLAAYLLAMRRLAPEVLPVAIAFPPVITCGLLGQNGLLTAAIFLAAIELIPRRRFCAGLVLGCLVIKPHLGIMIPLALFAGREWRMIAGAAAGVTGSCLIALGAFGWAIWAGFVAMLPLFGQIAADGLVGWRKLASVYASLRFAGAPVALAWGLHGIAALAGAVLLWRVWRTDPDPLARGAALAVATMLASPYLYVYDQVLLIVPLAWLWRRGLSSDAVVGLCLIPLASLIETVVPVPGVNLSPLLPLILLALVWHESVPIAPAEPEAMAE